MSQIKREAIFLDRDGVIVADKKYTHKIEDLELLDDIIPALKLLIKHNFLLFIATNQSGIGRGYYTENEMHNFHLHLLSVLKDNGISIQEVYFCPHTPNEECTCRKSNPRFARDAEKKYNLDLSNSYMLGDKVSDLKFGKNAGMSSLYILSGKEKDQAVVAYENKPAYSSTNVIYSTRFIINKAENKIVQEDSLEEVAKRIKKEGKSIVTLNGAFDILHKGHEKIIHEAKKQGDVLFLGLNDDDSIKKSKGNLRPLNNIEARLRALASFDEIDFVFSFADPSPVKFLEKIKPDVHVNGSDYGENCIEKDPVEKNGGRIHIVQLMSGYSSTDIISNNG